MLMPKKNRNATYELLFKEGMMVVHMPKHPELADKNVPNLHVMRAMQSRGYAKEQFAWRHFHGPLRMRASSISKIISTYLRRSYLPPCAVAVPKLACFCPKGQRVSAQQDSQEGRQTETPTGVLCPLVLQES